MTLGAIAGDMEHLIIDKLYRLLGYIPGNSKFDRKILANPDRAKKVLDRPAHEFFQEFFKDTKFSENSVLPDPIARLCAERFLTEERGHRFWPPSSNPRVPVWPGHRMKILEAMKNIFAKKYYSQTIKTYASQQPEQKKRLEGLRGTASSNRPKKRQRRSSVHEITEPAGIPSWNEGPKSPEPLTCANYVRSLKPEPDEIYFTMSWLDDKEAAWPESADAPLQRLMHDENFYIGHSWDDLGDEFREVYVALREGTEIDHPEAHQYNEFRRRVNNRVQQLTRKLLDDPFRILTDQAGSVEKSKLFRRKWQHKQAYWEVSHSDSEFSDSGSSKGQRTTKMPEPVMAPNALASMAAKAHHSYMAHQEYWGTPESHSATPSRSHTHGESSSPLSCLSSIDTIELESPQLVHANQLFGIEHSPQPSPRITLPIAPNDPAIRLASIDRDLPSTFMSEQNSFNANSTLSNTPVAPRARCENNEHPTSITAALNKSASDGLAITAINDHDDDDHVQLPSPRWVYYTIPKEKDPPSLRSRSRSTFSQVRAALQTSPQGQALWQSIEDDHTISSEKWAWCLRRLVNTISLQRLGPVNHARECVNRLNNEIIKRLNAPNARTSGYKIGLRQRDVIAAIELLKSGSEHELVVLELDSRRRRMLQLQYGPSGLLEKGLDFSRPFPEFGPSTVPEARDRIQDPNEDTTMQSDLNEGDFVLQGCEHRRTASAASQNVNMSETAPPVDFDPNLQGGKEQLLGGNIHATTTQEKTPEVPYRSAWSETAPLVESDPNLYSGYGQLPGGNIHATTTQEKTAPPVSFDPNLQGGKEQLLGGNIHTTTTQEKTPEVPYRSAWSETAPLVESDPNLHSGYGQLPGGNIHATTTQKKTPEVPSRSAWSETAPLVESDLNLHSGYGQLPGGNIHATITQEKTPEVPYRSAWSETAPLVESDPNLHSGYQKFPGGNIPSKKTPELPSRSAWRETAPLVESDPNLHSRYGQLPGGNMHTTTTQEKTAPPVSFDPNLQSGYQQLPGGNIHATTTQKKTPEVPSRSAWSETAPLVESHPNLHSGYQKLPGGNIPSKKTPELPCRSTWRETAPPVESDPNLQGGKEQLLGGNIHATTTQEKTPELPTMSTSREQEAPLKEVTDQHQLETPDKSPAPGPPRPEKPTEPISQGQPLLSFQSSRQNQNDPTENTTQEVGPHTSRPYNFIPNPDPYTSSRSNSDVLPTPTNDRLIKTYDPHTQNLVLIIDDASGNLDQVYPFQAYMKDSTLEEFFSFYSRISGTPFDRIKRLEFGMMFGPTERRRTLKVPRLNGEAAWMRLKEWAATLFEEAKVRERAKMEFAFMVQHV